MSWKSMAPLWVMVGGLAALYVVDRRHRSEESARLRAELQALAASARPEAAAAERVVIREPVYLSPAPGGAPPDRAGAPPGPAPSAAPLPGERVRALMDRFEAEPRVKGAAASHGEAVLRRRIASSMAESSAIESVDCRADTCRVELVHADAGASSKLLRQLFIGPEATIHGTDFVATSPEATADGRVRVSFLVPLTQVPEAL
jgi:hypothetical protein